MMFIRHGDGRSERNPKLNLSSLCDELVTVTPEHGCVTVINIDLRWRISAYRDGRVMLAELGKKGHAWQMMPVSKETVVTIWRLLTLGKMEDILLYPWKPCASGFAKGGIYRVLKTFTKFTETFQQGEELVLIDEGHSWYDSLKIFGFKNVVSNKSYQLEIPDDEDIAYWRTMFEQCD